MEPARDDVSRWGMVGVGCLGAVGGFFGGGMIAVLVAVVVGRIRRCEPPAGLPACNHMEFLAVGALAGVVLVPTVSIWLMRRKAGR